MEKRIIGIDFSLNSTGVCIKENGEYQFFWFPSDSNTKIAIKKVSSIMNVFLHKRTKIKKTKKLSKKQKLETNTNESFYRDKSKIDVIQASNLAHLIIDKLKIKGSDIIGFEGYSYGSFGQATIDLIHYQSVLRHEISKITDNFNVFSPTEIKSFFTNQGNSDKIQMIDSAIKENETLDKLFKDLNYKKPIDDLSDAYAVNKITEHTYLKAY